MAVPNTVGYPPEGWVVDGVIIEAPDGNGFTTHRVWINYVDRTILGGLSPGLVVASNNAHGNVPVTNIMDVVIIELNNRSD